VRELDKTEGELCPKCGQYTLSVYYEEETDLKIGAHCESCDAKGVYVNGELKLLVEA
jgi:hypothetical protein